ncbi:MAG: 2-C-methyl-D-erythritol 2,4-cyclodiphosphate synthase [Chloroflexi bacterium]|nr:2-C-methyl-D-erythritol 2,4-cyclodiphosphate synthase [Chloroflexota bacterium]
MRIGLGFDVHPLVSGRRLVLGGVQIPFEKGLAGWSDGDVLTHAIIDALLGAAGLGDIGQHFPPGEPEYRDISSLILLARVWDELKANGWQTGNIDANVLAERPKLQPFIGKIREQLAMTLAVAQDKVSIKAKTANGLGPIGRGEGIGAQAVALIIATDSTR